MKITRKDAAVICAGLGIGFYAFTCYGVYLAFKMMPTPVEAYPVMSGSFDDVQPLYNGLQGEERSIQLQPAINSGGLTQ